MRCVVSFVKYVHVCAWTACRSTTPRFLIIILYRYQRLRRSLSCLLGGHGLLRSRHKENLKLFCNDHQVLDCSSCNCRRSPALSSSDNSRGICLRIKILKRNGYSRPSLYCLEIIIQESWQQSAHISKQKQESINTITDCRRQMIPIRKRSIKLACTFEKPDSCKLLLNTQRRWFKHDGDSQVLSTFLKAKTTTTGY